MVGAPRPRLVYSLTDATPARTIWVYRNGDPFYLGRKFVINHRYVPNFEAFMIQLNEGLPMPFGVRNIYTPRYGHSVSDLPDFQQGGRYVVAGRERFKKLNYFSIGARKPQRKKMDEVIRPVVHSNIQVPSKWQSIYNKPRTINVFTNGEMLIPPIRILIPKFTLKSWNSVLGMINEKVSPRSGGIQRLCTLNGLILHGPDELEDYQFYVGCGNETFKYLPYWEHPKVPQYIRRNYPSSHEPPEKPPSKKLLIEPSQLQPPIHLLKGEGDRPSVYHAKPEKASRETTPRSLSPDHEPSVYKAQQPPEEIKGAQMIQEDKDIQVEMPVDQVDLMFQLRLFKKKTFIQMLGMSMSSLQKRTKKVSMRKEKDRKWRQKRSLCRKKKNLCRKKKNLCRKQRKKAFSKKCLDSFSVNQRRKIQKKSIQMNKIQRNRRHCTLHRMSVLMRMIMIEGTILNIMPSVVVKAAFRSLLSRQDRPG
ncbi:doublecortin domain-containing protein 2C isoform X2 [Anolis carolinensis]|uniref:doublecortin domain-containing protein 2C isoform X2 n=1 Tax=Anolis carolinensis TaxID=28377 RepID=UPI002F2B80F0